MAVKAIQQFMLGTVMNNEKQARETLRLLGAAGYEGIELCGFMTRPAGLMLRLITRAAGMPTGRGGGLNWPELVADSGLRVVAIHEDLGGIERDPQAILDEAARYGTDKIVVTGMYRFDYGDGDAVRQLARRLNAAGETLLQGGAQLLYHNHNCELRRVGDRARAYDVLIEETDPRYVAFEFDSYWMAEGGADPLAIMRRLGGRMRLWHINDRGARVSGPAMTPILKTDSMELGDGNLELDALSQQAVAAGVEAVILESHRNWIDGSPVKSFQRSAAYLNAHF